jgi:hypothetical protein
MRRILLPLALVALLAAGARAEDPLFELSFDGVRAQFHEGDVCVAREAARAVLFASDRIRRDLGLTLTPPPSLVLARGRAEFNALCDRKMPEWSIAAALPERNRIVLDAGKVQVATAAAAPLTVFHEVVHLALAQTERDRKDRLPQWFHEGLATWLSGARHLRGDQPAFDLAAAHDTLLPFSELRDRFPERPADAEVAYQQSEAFVAHLVNLRGVESLRLFFQLYGEGKSFDESFRGAFGMSPSGAETEWRAGLSRTYNWLATVLGVLSFWGLMALATLAVFLIVWRRSRKQQEEWEREETEWSVLPEEDADAEEEEVEEEDEPWEEDDDRPWRER